MFLNIMHCLFAGQIYASLVQPNYTASEGDTVDIVIAIEVEGSGIGNIRVFTTAVTAG